MITVLSFIFVACILATMHLKSFVVNVVLNCELFPPNSNPTPFVIVLEIS